MKPLPSMVHSGALALMRGLPTPITVQVIESHLLDIEIEELWGVEVSPGQLLTLARQHGLAPPARKTGRPGRPPGPVAVPYRRSGGGPLHVGQSHVVGRPVPADEVESFTDAEFIKLSLAADEPSRLVRAARNGNGTAAAARRECALRFKCRVGGPR